MDQKPTEYKTFPFKLTELDAEGRTIEGYASVFNNTDAVQDIVMPGAFRKTLEQRGDKVKFLWQHDPKEPIGKPLELSEDERGLFVKAIVSDTSRGRDALALLRDGAINEMSIGYDAIKGGTEQSKDDDGNEVRLLKELRLYEFSLVTFPANSEAQVTALKEDPAPSEAKPEPEVTENTIRIQVLDPEDFEEDSFRTITIGGQEAGVRATVGRLQGETTMTIQSYVFDKEKWDVERAQAWVDAHKKEAIPDDWEDKEVVDAEDFKATWTRAYINDLPDGSFLYIAPGGDKDEQGKTTPRSLRFFPYKDADGAVDLAHLRNAIARIPQSNAPGLDDAKKNALQERARELLDEAQKADEPPVPVISGEPEPADPEPVPEAVLFASVVLQEAMPYLDDWQRKVAQLAVDKLRGLYGEGADVEGLEVKAGRVLAARNAQRIGQALASLIEVLEDAGVDLPGLGRKPEMQEPDEEESGGKRGKLDWTLEIEAAELDLLELGY